MGLAGVEPALAPLGVDSFKKKKKKHHAPAPGPEEHHKNHKWAPPHPKHMQHSFPRTLACCGSSTYSILLEMWGCCCLN